MEMDVHKFTKKKIKNGLVAENEPFQNRTGTVLDIFCSKLEVTQKLHLLEK